MRPRLGTSHCEMIPTGADRDREVLNRFGIVLKSFSDSLSRVCYSSTHAPPPLQRDKCQPTAAAGLIFGPRSPPFRYILCLFAATDRRLVSA